MICYVFILKTCYDMLDFYPEKLAMKLCFTTIGGKVEKFVYQDLTKILTSKK